MCYDVHSNINKKNLKKIDNFGYEKKELEAQYFLKC
jgi:hypothetical protein